MKGETRQLDPEIAELVRDAVRDEGARLFTTPRLEDVAGLAALREPVRSTAPGLAKAERHLLQVHREEAAWLLRQASMAASMPRYGPRVHHYVDVHRRVNPAEPDELRARSENVLSRGRTALEDPDCVHGLETIVRDGQPAGAAALATLSLQLVPSDEARLCLYGALRLDGMEDLARTVALDVVGHAPSAINGSIAWSNIASALIARGEWTEARSAYRRAARQLPNPFAMMNWLFTACQLGDRTDALRAAATLEDTVSPEHPAVEEYESYRGVERFPLTPTYPRTTRLLLEQVGTVARKVIG